MTIDYSPLMREDVLEYIFGIGQDSSVIKMKEIKKYMFPELYENFGLTFTGYHMSTNSMAEDIMRSAIDTNRVNELLTYLFSLVDYPQCVRYAPGNLSDEQKVEYAKKEIISHINTMISQTDLKMESVGKKIQIISEIDKVISNSSFFNNPSISYITSLRDRCVTDLNSGDYDSVIVKSRTILEEVLTWIVKQKNSDYEPDGNIGDMMEKAKQAIGISKSGTPPGVQGIIKDLSDLVNNIANLRNNNSNAHAKGKKYVTLTKNEALLALNSSITVAEYMYNSYCDQSPINSRITTL
jgi:hypothetical protein